MKLLLLAFLVIGITLVFSTPVDNNFNKRTRREDNTTKSKVLSDEPASDLKDDSDKFGNGNIVEPETILMEEPPKINSLDEKGTNVPMPQSDTDTCCADDAGEKDYNKRMKPKNINKGMGNKVTEPEETRNKRQDAEIIAFLYKLLKPDDNQSTTLMIDTKPYEEENGGIAKRKVETDEMPAQDDSALRIKRQDNVESPGYDEIREYLSRAVLDIDMEGEALDSSYIINDPPSEIEETTSYADTSSKLKKRQVKESESSEIVIDREDFRDIHKLTHCVPHQIMPELQSDAVQMATERLVVEIEPPSIDITKLLPKRETGQAYIDKSCNDSDVTSDHKSSIKPLVQLKQIATEKLKQQSKLTETTESHARVRRQDDEVKTDLNSNNLRQSEVHQVDMVDNLIYEVPKAAALVPQTFGLERRERQAPKEMSGDDASHMHHPHCSHHKLADPKFKRQVDTKDDVTLAAVSDLKVVPLPGVERVEIAVESLMVEPTISPSEEGITELLDELKTVVVRAEIDKESVVITGEVERLTRHSDITAVDMRVILEGDDQQKQVIRERSGRQSDGDSSPGNNFNPNKPEPIALLATEDRRAGGSAPTSEFSDAVKTRKARSYSHNRYASYLHGPPTSSTNQHSNMMSYGNDDPFCSGKHQIVVHNPVHCPILTCSDFDDIKYEWLLCLYGPLSRLVIISDIAVPIDDNFLSNHPALQCICDMGFLLNRKGQCVRRNECEEAIKRW